MIGCSGCYCSKVTGMLFLICRMWMQGMVHRIFFPLDLCMWSLVELWPPYEIVAYPLKCLLPPLSDLIEYAFFIAISPRTVCHIYLEA